MASHTIALWAEPAPEQSGLMTAEELQHLPDDGWLYELVEGTLIRTTPVGFDHGVIEAGLGAGIHLCGGPVAIPV